MGVKFTATNRYAELGQTIRAQAAAVVAEHTQACVETMKQLCPVSHEVPPKHPRRPEEEHVHMRDTIEADLETATADVAQPEGVVKIGAYYWIYVNYGTRFMTARPFVEPAVEQQRAPFLADLGNILVSGSVGTF